MGVNVVVASSAATKGMRTMRERMLRKRVESGEKAMSRKLERNVNFRETRRGNAMHSKPRQILRPKAEQVTRLTFLCGGAVRT